MSDDVEVGRTDYRREEAIYAINKLRDEVKQACIAVGHLYQVRCILLGSTEESVQLLAQRVVRERDNHKLKAEELLRANQQLEANLDEADDRAASLRLRLDTLRAKAAKKTQGKRGKRQ